MKDLITVFNKGNKNGEFVLKINNQSNNLSFKTKYIIWLISIIFFSKRKCIDLKEVNFSYSKVHDKFFMKNNVKITHGGEIYNFYKIKKCNTIMCNFNIINRNNIILKSLYYFIRYKIEKKYIFMWIDFMFINEFIIKNNINIINICGHYDRYTTWITYICKKNNIMINISQHGAMAKYRLPYKIYCNNFYAFNITEKYFIKKNLIENIDCNFIIKGFKTNLIFKTLKKDEKKIYLGIASQPKFTKSTIEIINYINYMYKDKVKILLYPHFREDIEQYQSIVKEKKCELYLNEKHKDVDVLLTYYSTIIYDFVSINSNSIYVCYPPEGIFMSFFEMKNLKVIYQKKDLVKILECEIQNKGL